MYGDSEHASMDADTRCLGRKIWDMGCVLGVWIGCQFFTSFFLCYYCGGLFSFIYVELVIVTNLKTYSFYSAAHPVEFK